MTNKLLNKLLLENQQIYVYDLSNTDLSSYNVDYDLFSMINMKSFVFDDKTKRFFESIFSSKPNAICLFFLYNLEKEIDYCKKQIALDIISCLKDLGIHIIVFTETKIYQYNSLYIGDVYDNSTINKID